MRGTRIVQRGVHEIRGPLCAFACFARHFHLLGPCFKQWTSDVVVRSRKVYIRLLAPCLQTLDVVASLLKVADASSALGGSLQDQQALQSEARELLEQVIIQIFGVNLQRSIFVCI